MQRCHRPRSALPQASSHARGALAGGLIARVAQAASLLCGVGSVACQPLDHAPREGAGHFRMLTYNVAGLPQGFNDDQFPEVNIPQISPKLNAYDLVLVQEDFAYTAELRAAVTHPYRSYPIEEYDRFMGDGLNRLSRLAFDPEVTRVRWDACSGVTDGSSDCLANKGFSIARHQLMDGVSLTVVNLHAEAGGGPDDVAARESGMQQLSAYLARHHAGEALLIAGDTNLHGDRADDAAMLSTFIDETQTAEACAHLECGEEHIDRFFFRSGAGIELDVVHWEQAMEMVDDEGDPLSDHPALYVDVEWTAADE